MSGKYYEPIDEVTYGRAILLLPSRNKVDIPVFNTTIPVKVDRRNKSKYAPEKNVVIKFVWDIKAQSWKLLNPLLIKPKNRIAKIKCRECGNIGMIVNPKVTRAKCKKCGTVGNIKY